jgi:hypothetical protein
VSVVAAFLLCLSLLCLALLSLPASGSEGSSAAPPLDGTSLILAPVVEAEKVPVNADLLTMLFLAASFFGVSAGWLLSNARGQGALCFSLGVVGAGLGSTCADYLPFLGVFRL